MMIDRRKTDLLSVIVPLFNEEQVLPHFLLRLANLASELPMAVEFVLVNDGSWDRTAQILDQHCDMDARIKVVHLSRNFGHQIATTAGLREAQGEVLVIMDGDLQDPPELVLEMLVKYREGYDVVYAKRRTRNADNILKRLTARAFYRLMRIFVHKDLPYDVGDFRLMSRTVADVLNSMDERHRFIRGLICWIGFKQTFVEFDRPSRVAGQTKFSLGRMMSFALDAILSFSTKPLRLGGYLGIAAIFVSGIIAAVVGYMALMGELTTPGWASLIILNCFLSGVTLVSIGILGEYVGRIFEQTQGRPLYIVERRSASRPTEGSFVHGTSRSPRTHP